MKVDGTRRVSVCILIPSFGDGGAQKQCIKLLNALSLYHSINISVIYFHEGVHHAEIDSGRIQLIKLHVSSHYSPFNILRIYRLLRNVKPDILMTWLHASDVYGAVIKIMRPRFKWIMTERDSHYPVDMRYWLRRYLGVLSDLIIANSEGGRRYWLSGGPRKNAVVIPNIAPTCRSAQDDLNVKAVSTLFSYDVIYVGRLESQKNIGTICEAFCLLAERNPLISFAVIGAGSRYEDFSREVSRRGLCDRIRFLGFRNDAAEHIANSRLLVTLSHHEGTPNVVIEAIASGTPIVASFIPEHEAILGLNYPYYVRERTSPEAAARVIEQALDDPQERIESALQFGRDQLKMMDDRSVAMRYYVEFTRMAGYIGT